MYEYTAKYLYFGAAYLARSGHINYIMHAVIGYEPLQIDFSYMPPRPVRCYTDIAIWL